ncbi:MAG TPA: TauD/TfdA family dioxygenase [Caulobacteraceae bacterium]
MSACELTAVDLSTDRHRLLMTWADGAATEASATWLFDNVEGAMDPCNGQRLHGALDLDRHHRLERASIEGDRVRLLFMPAGVEGAIRATALRAAGRREPTEAVEPWLEPSSVAAAPSIDFADYLNDDAALEEALRRVVRHGLAFLAGAGAEPGCVERAVARFGFVRETNYGRAFGVRAEARAENLAYTPCALDLHTDNPYRDPPPTLQLLHAIEVAKEGGESQFADGFAHALALSRRAPGAYDVLRDQPVAFRFVGPSGDRYETKAPVIDTDRAGALRIIRVNHRSLRTADLDPAKLDDWYDAYLDFYRRLHAPEDRYERRLAAGEMVIFDNWRILHGRSAYDAAAPRWLQGCYADRDGLLATLERLSGPGSGPAAV